MDDDKPRPRVSTPLRVVLWIVAVWLGIGFMDLLAMWLMHMRHAPRP